VPALLSLGVQTDQVVVALSGAPLTNGMEPIGELDSVQHPLLHVCAGFRHFDVETVPISVGCRLPHLGLLAFVEAPFYCNSCHCPRLRMAQRSLGMVMNPNTTTQDTGAAKSKLSTQLRGPQ